MILRLQYLIFVFIGLIVSLTLVQERVGIFSQDEPGAKINYISELQKRTDVLSYDIGLAVDLDNKTINSVVTILGRFIGEPSSVIELNFSDLLRIEGVLLNQKKAEYVVNSDRIKILSQSLITDTFQVQIVYSGRPKNLGMWGFSFSRFNGSPVLYTISEPEYASTWFPCNDRPDDKALLSVEITLDKQYTGLSNGKLVSKKISGDKVTYYWKSSYPISTYLISVYASNYTEIVDHYVSITGDTLPLHYYVFPKDSGKAVRAFKGHSTYLRVFEDLFGPYPFIREKYAVASFLWTSGAMENQTITGFAYNMIDGLGMFSDVLIHELAHHWWGNSVGPASWKDIWLNEGFASYSEALYFEKVSGYEALQSKMQEFRDFDQTESLIEPAFIFSGTVYHKGAWVLHMLRAEMGDSVFFKFLKYYQAKYRYSNSSTKDLQQNIESFTGQNYNKFFDQWVYKGKGMIQLIYSLQQQTIRDFNNCRISIEQKQEGFPVYSFPLEIRFTGKSGESVLEKINVNFGIQEFEFNIPFKVAKTELDPFSRILLTAEEKKE